MWKEFNFQSIRWLITIWKVIWTCYCYLLIFFLIFLFFFSLQIAFLPKYSSRLPVLRLWGKSQFSTTLRKKKCITWKTPKRLMCPDVRVLWNIRGFVGGGGWGGGGVGNEIKSRGLFLRGSRVWERVHCKRGSHQESHFWNGNDKAWNTHNQLFSLAFKI